MRQNISILVGSGFSIPESIPSVCKLNQRLSKINESEIIIHTDQSVSFLNGQDDPNRWVRRVERIFVQEFLEFYSSHVLKSGKEFHYETFYDYYSGYLTKKENYEAIEDFYKRFYNKHKKSSDYLTDCYNSILNFNRSFNQLLASQLHKPKYFEDISLADYAPYDSFIGFLKKLLITYDIKFHSLNHDLFFDWLGRHHSGLGQYFIDGYQLEGSPYYGIVSYDFNHEKNGKVHKTYYVKLEHFIGKFDKPLALYKLHGSIYNTIVYTPQPDHQKIRLKDNYAVSRFLMEVTDLATGKQKFENLWNEVAPDFLSGTTNKTRYYTNDHYYKCLFSQFENNLLTSELLVVIGYGFQDPGINQYLERFFLSRGKLMVVIDPYKPKTDLIEKYKAIYIPKGVTQMTYQEYLEQIPPELKSNAE